MAVVYIAQQLAVGLLRGVGKEVGLQIVDQIFPSAPSNPSYFDAVYSEISKIIKQAIEQNTIEEVDGAVNGLKNWVKDTYTPRKASKIAQAGSTGLTAENKRDLHEVLSRAEYDLTTNSIGKLQEESFAEAGLGVFMIAAGIHLALLQELAFVDPDVQDPTKSSYVQSIKKTAQRYVAHATATYSSVETKRVALVGGIHKSENTDDNKFRTWDYHYKWKDDHTGLEKTYEGKSHHPNREPKGTRDKAEKERDDHIVQVKKQLNDDCQNVQGSIAYWSRLIQSPSALPDPTAPLLPEENADCKPM